MAEQIRDGKGGGHLAEVNSANQLVSRAITTCDCTDNSIRLSQSYEFANGEFLTLANDTNEHAVLYVQNTSSSKSLHIHEIRTCGTATIKWLLYKNDTAGTIVTDASSGVKVNHNFASANIPPANVYKASASGKSRSGGEVMSQHIDEEGHSEIPFAGAIILGQNDALTLTATLANAAANDECCVRIHAYFEDMVT
jgi:hypothetical protein